MIHLTPSGHPTNRVTLTHEGQEFDVLQILPFGPTVTVVFSRPLSPTTERVELTPPEAAHCLKSYTPPF